MSAPISLGLYDAISTGAATPEVVAAPTRGRRREGLGDVLDVLEELVPGRIRRLLVLLHPLNGVRGGVLDVSLVRAGDLRLQRECRVGEDLSDRGVAEERVLER